MPLRTPTAIQADADDELHALIDARIDHLIARGMHPDAARTEALHRLGADLDAVRATLHTSAEHRERRMRLSEHIETLIQDLKYATRGLARRPAFTVVAVLTLAIGIGATTAIFSAVNVLLLRPLPFARPDALMTVSLLAPGRGTEPRRDMVWSYPKFLMLRNNQRVFSSLAMYSPMQVTLTGDDPELIRGEYVGAPYLRTLGVPLARGHDFDPSIDDAPGAAKEVVLSYALWQRRFNLDPSVIGKTVDIDRAPYAIIGVAADGFAGATGQAEVFVPVTTRAADDIGEAQSHEFSVVARRIPGVTVERAAQAVNAIGERINDTFRDPFVRGASRWGATARPLDGGRVAPLVRRAILVLFAAVALVLLIACVNVANLMLGRASARRREIAVRLAIGAGRMRLVRLMLTESILLSFVGAAASLVVAWVGIHALQGVNPAAFRLPRGSNLGVVQFSEITLDWGALGFTLALAALVGVAFGFAPAFHATRATLADAIKQGDQSVNPLSGRRASGRNLLVVVEVALAIVLLAGSGLMLRSLAKLLSTNAGFDAEHVLTFRLTIPPGGVARDSMPGFYAQLLERMRAVPGVTNAAISNCAPLSNGCNGTLIEFKDRPGDDVSTRPLVGVYWATTDLLATLRIPLEHGRNFTSADRVGAPKVVLVNETAARRFWPNESPIGKRVGIGQGGFGDGAEVVGIVGDVREWADSLPRPLVYLPYLQSPSSRMIIFLRTTGNPAALGAAVRAALHDMPARYPIYDMQPMSQRVASATAQSRFSAVLLALFAATALSLAAIGIYGVMSLAVASRTREIGIRIALGADRRRVQRLVVGEGLALAGTGAAIGVAGALMSTRVLQSFLFDTRSSDPSVYIGVLVVLGTVALAASWLPARRAASVDPLRALRAD